MKRFFLLSFVCLQLLITGCDRPAPIEDLDREEEVPVEDTFEPVPNEIP